MLQESQRTTVQVFKIFSQKYVGFAKNWPKEPRKLPFYKSDGLLCNPDKTLRYPFVDRHTCEQRIDPMCRVLQISVSGYYAWIKREPSVRDQQDEMFKPIVNEIFEQHSKRYGSPRVQAELTKKKNLRVSRKRVARLMREQDLVARRRKRRVKTTDSNQTYIVSPNLLERQFDQKELNQVWCGDITYIPTLTGFVYLATVMDLGSRRIIDWHISDRIDEKLVIIAFWRALKTRRNSKQGPPLILHSDRGSQYASKAFRYVLKRFKIIQSMSRRANCWGNAVAESFSLTSKGKSELSHMILAPSAAARSMTFRHIEGSCNCQRMHSKLCNLSPLEYGRRMLF